MLKDDDVVMVRQSVTMAQVAGMYGYTINRAGFIKCPFHSDKSPSLKVYDGTRGYYCFVCHEGGDVIHFVMKHDGLKFESAVRHLAEMFNIPISDGKSGISEADKERMKKRLADRKAMEEERKAARESLSQLSSKIRSMEEMQGCFEPLSDVWCRLQEMIMDCQRAWQKTYDEVSKKDRG